ncbi:hypothetical protein [Paraburkholderia fungorum]|uniref:hypothetical protein n=1 Tax=Paraburkholderia fungorum TaxID=134537 RepID=UPI0038B9F775
MIFGRSAAAPPRGLLKQSLSNAAVLAHFGQLDVFEDPPLTPALIRGELFCIGLNMPAARRICDSTVPVDAHTFYVNSSITDAQTVAHSLERWDAVKKAILSYAKRLVRNERRAHRASSKHLKSFADGRPGLGYAAETD